MVVSTFSTGVPSLGHPSPGGRWAGAEGELSLTILLYHYIRDPGDPCEAGTGIPGLPTVAFEAQLDDASRAYEIVSWPTVRAFLLGQGALPPRACLLTFDDGVCDHYLNVFPRLRARGLSGLFFALARPSGAGLPLAHRLHFLLPALGLDGLRRALSSYLSPEHQSALRAAETHYRAVWPDPVDAFKTALQRESSPAAEAPLARLFAQHIGSEPEVAASLFLSPTQVTEMQSGGMHFGGHSRSHPWLDWVGDEVLAAEAGASAAWLQTLEPGPWAFAYPFGGFDERTPAALARAGFCAAFTTQPQVRHTSVFHLGRLDGEALPPALVNREVHA
jgi:peptidoglycan/xylan/chitin deacetylase (PgdA/CDA1 family)